MTHVYDREAPKQAISLDINVDLLHADHDAGLNVSAVLEEALVEKLAAAKREHGYERTVTPSLLTTNLPKRMA